MMPPRTRRAWFGDVRFLVGVALVILSVAGVWLLVSSSRQTTPVLQTTRTLVPGEEISSADFQVVEVGLGALTDSYLAPQDLDAGMVATRTVPKGELVPRTATGTAEEAGRTTVVVASTALPAGVDAGTVVELWHAPLLEDGRSFDAPRILIADAVVATVAESEGMLSQAEVHVELVIDRADVADVLAAITGGAALSIVPAGAGS